MYIEYNTKIIEIRFCPTLHIQNGLSENEIIESVINGFKKAQNEFNSIKGGIILCILRRWNIDHGYNIVKLAKQYLNNGIIGVDIAGNEGIDKLIKFESILNYCNIENIPMTIHAGEWTDIELETEKNIQLCLKYDNIKRIGHGLTLVRDVKLMNEFKNSEKCVECCMTSNIGFGKKCQNYKKHPSKIMMENGINVTLNCDNLLLSGDYYNVPSPNNELIKFVSELDMSWLDVKTVLMNGIRWSFDTSIDETYVKKFENEIDEVFEEYGIKLE